MIMKCSAISKIFELLLAMSLVLLANGAKVELFKEANFKGAKTEINSSANCANLPTDFLSFNGSLKTSGCIVLYSKLDCSDVTDYRNKLFGYTHVVESEEYNLSRWNFTYKEKQHQDFHVNSLRDCTEMESRPQADFDFYSKNDFTGEITKFRDVCTCTSLPSDSNIWGSANTYGNCFIFSNSKTCSFGSSDWVDTTHAIRYPELYALFSMKPCYVPEPCKRYKATVFNFEPTSTILTLPVQKVQNASHQLFINNGSVTGKQIYEMEMEVNESFQIEVPSVFKSLHSFNFSHPFYINFEAASPFPESSTPKLKAALMTALEKINANWNESLSSELSNKTKIQFKEEMSMLPCTTNEVRAFVEVTEIEVPYRFQFTIVGKIKNSEEQLTAEDISRSFKNITVIDNGTMIAETTMKIKLSFVSKNWTNITQKSNSECRRREIALAATVIKLTPGKIEPSIQRHAITTKQIMENNGTIQQQDNYEATRKIQETASFQFPKELARIRSMNFKAGLKSGIEISNPFISSSWTELQSGLSTAFQNRSNSQDAIVFQVQEETEYRVQRRISVPPCTSYEVNSFVEMVEHFEIPYQVQFEITGKLENEVVRADEIQAMLEGMKVLKNQNNFTVVAETTTKLSLTYGVGSGVEAVGTSMIGCRNRFIKFDASMVNLELLTKESNSTMAVQKFHVAPKLVFINNSTTQHEETYESSKIITETTRFEFLKDISQINFLKIEEIVKSKLEKSIPFLPSVWLKLNSGFIPNQSNWNETLSFEVQNEKEFRIQKNIVQAPCMRYEISSFIEMAKDVEVDYRVLLEVTGELGSEIIRAREIRGNLKDLIFLRDKDDLTVIAETTMKLRLNYGLATGVDTIGTQMLDCMEVQASLVANCKFTCSG